MQAAMHCKTVDAAGVPWPHAAKIWEDFKMEYRSLGSSGLKVSLHSLGTMNFAGEIGRAHV